MTADEFGFTNDPADFEKVVAWREAAVADGWSIRPTYEGHESQDSAARLTKDGFVASVLARSKDGKGKFRYEAKISIWGPDGLAIQTPEEYAMTPIVVSLRRCNECGRSDVDTFRYSFAGRGCADCLPELRRKHEYPGWNR